MPTVQVGDLELYYADDDFADPWTPHDTVVMLHGFGRNGNFWRGWVPCLSRNFRVLRVDMRGCGGSSDPGREYAFHIEDMCGDVLGLLDGLGISAAHIVGESGGGVVAAWLAGRHPERCRSLVLVSTPLRLVRHDNPVKSAGLASAREALRQLGMRGWWLESRRAGAELTGQAERDEYFASEFARTPLHVGLAFWTWIDESGVDLTMTLRSLSMPTLLMTPGTSHGTSLAEQHEIASLIPNVKHLVYGDVNHEMYYLVPDRIAPDALAFLQEVCER